MKWGEPAQSGWRGFFAAVPHNCDKCGSTFWLEPGWRLGLSELSTTFRCSDCAPEAAMR